MTLSGTLWMVLAFPLGAAVALFAAFGRLHRRAVASIAIGSATLALAAAIYHAVRLYELPPAERMLAQHLWRLVRVGQLDANLDLATDPLSAVASVALAAIGLVVVTWTTVATEASPRVISGLCLSIASLLLVVLSGNLVAMLLGWQGALLVAVLASRPRLFALALAGDACVVAGAALLFWGMGGMFASGGYVTDLSPRFVAARSEQPSAAAPARDDDDDEPRVAVGSAFLTMTSYPGAVVYLDESRTPLMRRADEPLRAPFVRFPIRSGRHEIRIHAGGGQDDYLVHTAVAKDAECALTLRGPSLSFYEMKPELADSPLAKSGALATLACILLFFGIAAKTVRVAITSGEVLAQTPVVVAGVYALARVGFVFALAPVAGDVMVGAGAVVAVLAAASGFFEDDVAKALGRAAVAHVGVLLVALGSGAHAAAIAALVAYVPAMAVMVIANDARRERAYFAGAIAASIAPLPLFALFAAPAIALVAAALGAACAGFVVWRSYHLAFASKRRRAPTAIAGVALVAFAALGVVAGGVLGVLTGKGLEIGALVLGLGASAAGWAVARARYGFRSVKAAEARDRAAPGYALLRGGFHLGCVYEAAVEAPVLRLSMLVAEMDRWVIDGVVNGVALLARAGAWILGALDDGLVDAAPHRAAEAAVRVATRSRFLRAGLLEIYVYLALAAVVLAAILIPVLSD